MLGLLINLGKLFFCQRCQTVRHNAVETFRWVTSVSLWLQVMYCGPECQKLDWANHKLECVEQTMSTAPGNFIKENVERWARGEPPLNRMPRNE